MQISAHSSMKPLQVWSKTQILSSSPAAERMPLLLKVHFQNEISLSAFTQAVGWIQYKKISAPGEDESLVSLWTQSTENCPHKLFSLFVGRTSDKWQHLEWPTPSGWWWLTATCLSPACKKKKSTISSCSLYFDMRLVYQVKTKKADYVFLLYSQQFYENMIPTCAFLHYYHLQEFRPFYITLKATQ